MPLKPGEKNIRPALFLDRDGVINEETGYLHRFEQVRFLPGIADLLIASTRLGFFNCVITNQSGIARGLYTEDDFHLLMGQMREELRVHGASLDAVYFSPFHPDAPLEKYRRNSNCRKPGPGMLLRATAEHSLDLSRSIMVGDRCTDLEAAAAAGVPHLFLLASDLHEMCSLASPYIVADSLEVVRRSLARLAVAPCPGDTSA